MEAGPAVEEARRRRGQFHLNLGAATGDVNKEIEGSVTNKDHLSPTPLFTATDPFIIIHAYSELTGERLVDPIAKMKEAAREGWSTFAPFEMTTGSVAPMLVKFAGIHEGTRVLDVGCGTGVVALTAARVGAEVSGLDLTPALLDRARENATLAGLAIEFREGDVEDLSFDDESFDYVVSQFGHMFGPRPDIAIGEMLRVLKSSGIIAFSTWPPDFFTGRLFKLIGGYAPPPPEGVSSPVAWGDPNVVRQRLGDAVADLAFDSGTMRHPALSPVHLRLFMEVNAGPVSRLVESLADDAERLTRFRTELENLISNYFDDNTVRQDFLMTRATKI